MTVVKPRPAYTELSSIRETYHHDALNSLRLNYDIQVRRVRELEINLAVSNGLLYVSVLVSALLIIHAIAR